MELQRSDFDLEIGRNTPVNFDEKWRNITEEYFISLPENTRKAYKTDLSQFIKFLWVAFKFYDPLKVEQLHIQKFMKFIEKLGGRASKAKGPGPASKRTYNRKLACVRSFYQYLGKKGYITVDPSTFVKGKKMPLKVETNELPPEKVLEMLSLIPLDSLKNIRDHAMLTTYFYTSARKDELRPVKIKDYKIIMGTRVFTVHSKGGVEDAIPLNDEVVAAVDRYINALEESGVVLEEDNYIFRPIRNNWSKSRDGVEILNKPLHPSSITGIFDKWVGKLNLDYKITPHSARATAAGMIHEITKDLRETAIALRHKDPRMSAAYIKKKLDITKSPLKKLKY